MIERGMDLALKADPDLEPGILFVERQFGILEIHGSDKAKLLAAGRAVLKGMGLTEGDQLAPRILFTDVIEAIAEKSDKYLGQDGVGEVANVFEFSMLDGKFVGEDYTFCDKARAMGY